MVLPFLPAGSVRQATVLLASAMLSGFAVLAVFAARPDQLLSDAVGEIDGESIAVTGPMRLEVVDGQARTMLRSGSDVRVKSGAARIDLVEGGQISICGPAHLSVLKSGGSLTVALDAGIIHAHLPSQAGIKHGLTLTIYTAQIQARPMAIGEGPQDVLIGFDAPGSMCIRANRGALRVEQQLTDQSVIIPQTGDVLLSNGRLENMSTGASHCNCELQTGKAPPATRLEVTRLATAEEAGKNALAAKADPPPAPAEKPAVTEEPIYQVFMPPLIYDAKARLQPQVDPRMILAVRRLRVRPTLVFQGRVEGELVASAQAATASPASGNPAKAGPTADDSFFGRVRNFVRKLWSRGS